MKHSSVFSLLFSCIIALAASPVIAMNYDNDGDIGQQFSFDHQQSSSSWDMGMHVGGLSANMDGDLMMGVGQEGSFDLGGLHGQTNQIDLEPVLVTGGARSSWPGHGSVGRSGEHIPAQGIFQLSSSSWGMGVGAPTASMDGDLMEDAGDEQDHYQDFVGSHANTQQDVPFDQHAVQATGMGCSEGTNEVQCSGLLDSISEEKSHQEGDEAASLTSPIGSEGKKIPLKRKRASLKTRRYDMCTIDGQAVSRQNLYSVLGKRKGGYVACMLRNLNNEGYEDITKQNVGKAIDIYLSGVSEASYLSCKSYCRILMQFLRDTREGWQGFQDPESIRLSDRLAIKIQQDDMCTIDGRAISHQDLASVLGQGVGAKVADALKILKDAGYEDITKQNIERAMDRCLRGKDVLVQSGHRYRFRELMKFLRDTREDWQDFQDPESIQLLDGPAHKIRQDDMCTVDGQAVFRQDLVSVLSAKEITQVASSLRSLKEAGYSDITKQNIRNAIDTYLSGVSGGIHSLYKGFFRILMQFLRNTREGWQDFQDPESIQLSDGLAHKIQQGDMCTIDGQAVSHEDLNSVLGKKKGGYVVCMLRDLNNEGCEDITKQNVGKAIDIYLSGVSGKKHINRDRRCYSRILMQFLRRARKGWQDFQDPQSIAIQRQVGKRKRG